jgi:hypothetical protein
MAALTDAWHATKDALPPGWRLEGLRCTSTGLAPEQRGDRWLAEACGPRGACVKVEMGEPAQALAALTEKVRGTDAASRA